MYNRTKDPNKLNAQKWAIRQNYAKKNANSQTASKGEEYPHLRRARFGRKHPTLIVRENKKQINKYDCRDISHKGGSKYSTLPVNPEPGRREKSYISKGIETLPKNKFFKNKLDWDMSKIPDKYKK